MECLAEMPHAPLDRRPRKRQRLGWDVGPEIAQVLSQIRTRFDL
jgi:dual-specificity kinase